MWDYVVLASAWSLRESWRRRGAESRVEERKQGRGEDRRGEDSPGESWQGVGVERRKEVCLRES